MDFDEEELTEEFETVTLSDDTGEEIEFIILDKITDSGKEYVLAIESALIDDENAEANIFKKAEEDVYELIEDDDEFDKVANLFNLASDEYDVEID